jgi:hypothetical protein
MDKLDHLGWVVSSSYAIGDVRFAVRSTSHAFGEWLAQTLGAYEVEDVEDFLYSVVVPEAPSGGRSKEFFILYKGSSAIVRTLDPSSLGRAFLTELEGHRLVERDDAAYLMASVAELPGGAVLIPNALGPGLARLGRRAERLGIGVPGQYTVGVDLEAGVVTPIHGGLDLSGDPLAALTSAFPWQGRDGLRFVHEPLDVQALMVPAREEGDARQARKGYALAALTGWNLNLERVGGRGLRALGMLVERTPCYEVGWTRADTAMSDLATAMDAEGGS